MTSILSKIGFCAALFLLIFSSCKDETYIPPRHHVQNPPNNPSKTWLVPAEDVLEGGPGQDGIPSIDDPFYESVANADQWLDDDDLIIAVRLGDIIRAYPHPILDWHEIVNDQLDTLALAITYCPLTGTGIGWNRKTERGTTTFGVSGLLYQTNLMPYDRNTNSIWSQMLLKSVNGNLISSEINTFQMVETSWKTWKEMYPQSEVLSRSTGYNRNYGFYPYGNYRKDHNSILFPIDTLNTRLPAKERVLSLIQPGRAWAFRFSKFTNGITIIQPNLIGTPLVVVGSQSHNFIVAYNPILEDGTELNFEAVEGKLPIVMKDNEGNEWDIFGYAISGDRKGTRLKHVNSFMGYWFTFPTFYETIVFPG